MTNLPTNHAENFYKNSTFTKIKLENGKESSITVLFNNSEISMEEINRFLKKAISQTPEIKTYQTTFGTLIDGNFKPTAIFSTNENTHAENDLTAQLIEVKSKLIECLKTANERQLSKIEELELELKEYKEPKAYTEMQQFRFN